MNDLSNQTLSIVTVCYNASRTLEATMQSIVGQTFDDYEYIVIDGKSTDGTLSIIQKYGDHVDQLVSEPDHGIFDAMNKALSIAHGKWVYFLNAGDVFAGPDVLLSIPWASLETKTAFYGDMIYVRGTSEEHSVSRPVSFLHESMPASHQAFFVKTEAARTVGFNTRYKFAADYNMMFQLINKNGDDSFAHIPVTIAKYEAAEGFSSRYPNDVFGEVIAIRSQIKKDWQWYWDYTKYQLKKKIGYKSEHR